MFTRFYDYLISCNRLSLNNCLFFWCIFSLGPIAADLYQKSLINYALNINASKVNTNTEIGSDDTYRILEFYPNKNFIIVGNNEHDRSIEFIFESNQSSEKILTKDCFSNIAQENPVNIQVNKIVFDNEGKKANISFLLLPNLNPNVKNQNLMVKVQIASDNKNSPRILVSKNVEVKKQYEPEPLKNLPSLYKGRKIFLVADTIFFHNQKNSKFKELLKILNADFNKEFPDGVQIIKVGDNYTKNLTAHIEGANAVKYSSSNFEQVIKDVNSLLADHSEIQRVFLLWACDEDIIPIVTETKPSEKIKMISVGNSLDIGEKIVTLFSASKIQDIKNNYEVLLGSIRNFITNDNIQ